MSVQLERRLFNVTEYHLMVEAGILTEDDRVELIDGEIIAMSPVGSRHAACVDRLNALLHALLGGAAIVRVQSPVVLNDYREPQPDLALLRPQADFYAQGHPAPGDVFWVVEVAETSGGYDREVKLGLYAESAIAEVWLIDLTREILEVYTQPVNGVYQSLQSLGRGQALRPESFPHLALAADAVFG
jgi:Uma2 family endonuclease